MLQDNYKATVRLVSVEKDEKMKKSFWDYPEIIFTAAAYQLAET